VASAARALPWAGSCVLRPADGGPAFASADRRSAGPDSGLPLPDRIRNERGPAPSTWPISAWRPLADEQPSPRLAGGACWAAGYFPLGPWPEWLAHRLPPGGGIAALAAPCRPAVFPAKAMGHPAQGRWPRGYGSLPGRLPLCSGLIVPRGHPSSGWPPHLPSKLSRRRFNQRLNIWNRRMARLCGAPPFFGSGAGRLWSAGGWDCRPSTRPTNGSLPSPVHRRALRRCFWPSRWVGRAVLGSAAQNPGPGGLGALGDGAWWYGPSASLVWQTVEERQNHLAAGWGSHCPGLDGLGQGRNRSSLRAASLHPRDGELQPAPDAGPVV